MDAMIPQCCREINFKLDFATSFLLSGLSSNTNKDDSDGWYSILGEDWHSASSISTQPTEANSAGSISEDSVPDLLPINQRNGSESDGKSLFGDDKFSDGESVQVSEVTDENDEGHPTTTIRAWIQQEIQTMYE
jgi:hypothetical protein